MTVDLPALLADLERLVRRESPSSDQGVVARSADLVAEIGTSRLGLAPERLVVDGCTHLRWHLGTGPRRVLLLAHHDTVWPIGALLTHPWAVVDGVITGPGCFDMKTGLVMAFHALAELENIDGVTLLVTGDEEIGSPTSRALIEDEAAACAAVLVLEAAGPGGALKTARKGVSRYLLQITGRAAHAGLEPEKGVNAGIELAHQVLAIAALVGVGAPGTTITPTTSVAGSAANTVPATATVEIDCRMWTTVEQDRVHGELSALVPVLPGSTLLMTGGPNRPPMESQGAQTLFALAQEAAESLGLPVLTQMAVGGASDGNFTAGIGVPTLDGLGAVGGGAHSDDEHVLVTHLTGRTDLLAALVRRLLAAP
ncbi:glutamate carboxypeptidase [Nakamurella sp. UYEF19]|uniref:M20 family metallopeptidase n=1 Tax=Nakamurella sp. UYEF19 TaxID=1756392 RepID=UPI003399FD89